MKTPFRVGDSTVDHSQSLVIRGDERVRLSPKSMDVLIYLCEHPGETVSRDTLLDLYWRGSFSADNAVPKAISEIRKALADDLKEPRYLATVPKRGYRLIADVSETTDPDAHSNVTIAVLPFENQSPEEDMAYFADGMQEDVMIALTRVPDLQVLPRKSVLQLDATDLGVAEIASQLEATHLVEGSVRRIGQDMRVSIQLIYAESNRNIWGQTYDGQLLDLFSLQNEIAFDISQALNLPSAPVVLARPTDSIDAYDLFLRARLMSRQMTSRNVQQILEMLDESIELSPNFAEAYALKATVRLRSEVYPGGPPFGALVREAMELAESGLSLAPESPETQLAMAQVLSYAPISNFAKAQPYFESVLESRPYHSEALVEYGQAAASEQSPLALELFQRAVHADPSSAQHQIMLALAHQATGNLAAGRRHLERAIALEPDNVDIRFQAGNFFKHALDYEQALHHFYAASLVDPDNLLIAAWICDVFVALADPEPAAYWLARMQRINANHLLSMAFQFRAYTQEGDIDSMRAMVYALGGVERDVRGFFWAELALHGDEEAKRVVLERHAAAQAPTVLPMVKVIIAELLRDAGEEEASNALLQKVAKMPINDDRIAIYGMPENSQDILAVALAHGVLGQSDRALEALQRYVQEGADEMPTQRLNFWLERLPAPTGQALIAVMGELNRRHQSTLARLRRDVPGLFPPGDSVGKSDSSSR